MTTRAVEEVDEWDSRPLRGGYRGLHDLADEEFSGVVRSGRAKLCMLNGTVVGVLDGETEDFEDAEGTAYEAPSPALPLLALMQDRSDEVRAKYYTEDTPISEVDDTLSDGGFTGYIELSENVLSGDYYVVYHNGRSMAVAFVGNTGQLLTDDEAFERADGEVGIYEVRPADVDHVEVPAVGPETDAEPGSTAGAGTAASTTDATGTPGPEATTDATGTPGPEATTDAAPDEEPTTDASTSGTSAGDWSTDTSTTAGTSPGTGAGADRSENADAAGDSTGTADAESTGTARESSPERTSGADRAGSEPERASESGSEVDAQSTATDTGRSDHDGRSEHAGTVTDAGDPGRESGAPSTGPGGSAPESEGAARDAGGSGSAESGGVASPDEVETRSIPSLDPSRTSTQSDEGAGTAGTTAGVAGGGTADAGGRPEEPAGRDAAGTAQSEASGPAQSTGPAPGDGASRRQADGAATGAGGRTDAQGSGSRVADLEARLEERAAERDRLESDLAGAQAEAEDLRATLEDVRAERDDLRERVDGLETDRDRLRAERDDLEAEVTRLEDELDRVETQLRNLEDQYGTTAGGDRQMNPMEALDQTNLFVRYGSKGRATLESAHGGNASRQEVSENLDLEYHTQFDAGGVAVGGLSFDDFLRGTIQYRFVSWLVDHLLYEIRDTGKTAALQELYDAIPRIDRAELDGTIRAEYTEDGQERRTEESFDVVARDRMGNPLVVANLNDAREAATENMMSSLVTASSRVGESTDSLAASFLVTSSFFEPEALETAADATSGGLLSRDKRESFVKLSRKRGYHLCLVEAREEKFHLAVPEL